VGVLVFGMHRAGTSAVTLALHRLGFALGDPSDFMPAGAGNPRGYGESRSLSRFNDTLLAGLGGAWFEPPFLGRHWEQHPRLEPERRRGAALFAAVHVGEKWVWKDPRNCLLAPFWDSVLGCRHAACIVVRNPLEVCSSLQQRDGLSRQHALRLWQRYMSDALVYAVGRRVLVTSYEQVLSDPDTWFERVDPLLATHDMRPGWEEQSRARAELDTGLRHSREGRGDLDNDPEIPDVLKRTYALLVELEGFHDPLEIGPSEAAQLRA
jgi:hypothetical protein